MLHGTDIGAVRQPEEEVVDTEARKYRSETLERMTISLALMHSRSPSTLLDRDDVDIGITPPVVRRIRRRRGLEVPVVFAEPLARLGARDGRERESHCGVARVGGEWMGL